MIISVRKIEHTISNDLNDRILYSIFDTNLHYISMVNQVNIKIIFKNIEKVVIKRKKKPFSLEKNHTNSVTKHINNSFERN